MAATLVLDSSCTATGAGELLVVLSGGSSLVKDGTCSSSDGMVMSSGGAGGANIGCTGAGNTAGVTGGSSFMSGRVGWLGGLDTMMEEGTE